MPVHDWEGLITSTQTTKTKRTETKNQTVNTNTQNQTAPMEFKSFEDYCRHKWEFGPRTAYYLMAAAEVFTHLCTNCADRKPERESQLRPLLRLAPEDAKRVWDRAVENAGGRKLTAARVKEPPTTPLVNRDSATRWGKAFGGSV